MDTREKILSPEQAVARAREARERGARVTLVSGHFDPLLAEHARQLGELAAPGGWLVVVVSDPPAPLLPARARAELVAALRAVDCVVVGAAPPLVADAVLDQGPEDLQRARDFMAHVRARAGA